ncbi:MAG: hypothetical protein DCC49_09245 [Acidobacteria bacterium]|nr:MAG: hypothetical protein DCC49_09245 [Acidobacteriota bacterium]
MEHDQGQTPVPDLRAARAAHSLYRNRQHLERVLERIDRASAVLETSLALLGQTSAVFGLYEVVMADERELLLFQRPEIDGRQLPLPDPALGPAVPPAIEDLTPEQVALIDRAEAGDLPCPHCGSPLTGEPIQVLDEVTVRLRCPGGWCSFEEI